MLAPLKRRAHTRQRQARFRERRKTGIRVYRLALPDTAVEGLIRQMIATGRLNRRRGPRSRSG